MLVIVLNVGSASYKGIQGTPQAALEWWATPDVEIPEMTAWWWVRGTDFLPGSGWSPFDRGPLQPGLLVLSGVLWAGPHAIYVFSVVLNSVWVVGLWALLRACRIPSRRAALVIVAVALAGPVWVNTVYPWPKMLAAGLGLLCAAYLIQRRPVAAGLSAAGALISHGSSLFVIVGLIPFAVYWLRRRALIAGLIAVAPAAIWSLLPAFIAAPGAPRLIQWHFAGTDIQGITTKDMEATTPPLTAIVRAYGEAGWDVITNKLSNARVFLGDWTAFDRQLYVAADGWKADGGLGSMRIAQLLHFGWAPGLMWFGVLGAARVPRVLWGMVGAWSVVFVLLEFGGLEAASTWLHAGPYALLLLLIACLALGFGQWLKWVVACQALIFIGMWLTAPPVGAI
jgi:hypothetical protein